MEILHIQLWSCLVLMLVGGISCVVETRHHKNHAAMWGVAFGCILAAIVGAIILLTVA